MGGPLALLAVVVQLHVRTKSLGRLVPVRVDDIIS